MNRLRTAARWPPPLATHSLPRRQFFSASPSLQTSVPRLRSQFPKLQQQQHQSKRTTITVSSGKTGFIDVAPGESLLYFDNVFPLKTAVYDLRYLIMRLDRTSLESRITSKCLPPTLRSNPERFTITDIIPRLKDGGAFIKFVSETNKASEIEKEIQSHLKSRHFKPWFAPMTRVRSFLVRGKPWLEDLYRFPSSRLKVEFVPGDNGVSELSQEALYAIFRRFGKIADIMVPPPGSKDLPKSAVVQFIRMRSATAARNCLHGLTVPEITAIAGKEGGVTLRILYDRVVKTRWIRDWLVSHPRLVIPVLAAIITTIAVTIFDPVRTWFIETKITRSWDITQSTYWGWLKSNTLGLLQKKDTETHDISALWEERVDSIKQLKGWLAESEETFIVVQGPRGSGKRELVVDSVLADRMNVLILDCEPIHEAHGDSATISAAAQQVGYRPIFSWLNNLSSLLDLAAQGVIGTKAGFSQTLESQFNKILQNTGIALKQIALKHKNDTDKGTSLSDDEYLSAHPEQRPVLVIDNFLHIDTDSIIYSRLADWAALLVSSNVAHVIFLTNDITFSKSLSKSLPDRIFRTIFLGDATPDSAARYVKSQIANDPDTPTQDEKFSRELNDAIKALGGRLTDLEFLSRRIKLGESPSQAVDEIISTSAGEILKLHLSPSGKRRWSPAQAWLLVSALAEKDVGYNSVCLHDVFPSAQDGDEMLQALEQAELITVDSRGGLPRIVKPGKPVYRAAFQKLKEDNVLRAKMEMELHNAVVKANVVKIKNAEEELATIQPMGVLGDRLKYLVRKCGEWQGKIEKAEKEVLKAKGVLLKEG